MTKEQIKAKAKEQFPNDESKQQIVIDAINWATKELQEQIEKITSALIDIKSNTDDVNIEWQIKYLFDELGIKEND